MMYTGRENKGNATMRNLIGAFLILLIASAPSGLLAQQLIAEEAQAAPVTAEVLSSLSAEERAELLSRLSDEQARALLVEYLQASAEPDGDQDDSAIEQLEARSEVFRENLIAALKTAPRLPQVPVFLYQRLSEERDVWRPLRVVLYLAIIFAVAYVGERLSMRLLSPVERPLEAKQVGDFLERFGRAAGILLIDLIGLAIFTAISLVLFFVLYDGHEPTQLFVLTLITAVVLYRAIVALSRMFFAPRRRVPRVVPLGDPDARTAHRYVQGFGAVGAFGLLGCDLLQLLGLEANLHLFLLLSVGTAFFAVLIAGIWRLRQPVGVALMTTSAGESPAGIVVALAALWYVPVILYIAVIYVLAVFNGFSGRAAGTAPGVSSLVLIAMLPLADRILCGLIDRVLGSADEAAKDSQQVFRRAMHILVGVIAVVALATIWGANPFGFEATSIGGRVARAALDIALTIFVGYLAWGLLKAMLTRHMPVEAETQATGAEGGGTGTSRLGTILPLFMRMAQISIIVMVVMVILSALGVNIGPLLAGAGVIGIAVGFGAQTLVRDLVSGLFFLIDDAFRRGEYIDIGSVRGTVERINVRSLALRHHLGMLHTVPYGEIQHLTNYSRDWVIMKLEFRVGYDTDIDQVKKIFKQIGREMLEHPELGKNFIEPFKSQGVKSMEESAIIVRGKFMARPGTQFQIRKELYLRVQKAFQEAGIEFAHRRVKVDLPQDLELSAEKKKEIAELAGAAAAADDEKRGRAGG
ncbi:MAG: mechanosensitive ion channel [Rhodospirillales bacterium]|nr:MAG: mechanosensitive ion channel [Rhodospirillales bacterium]